MSAQQFHLFNGGTELNLGAWFWLIKSINTSSLRDAEPSLAVIRKYARFNPRPDQLGRYIVGILLGSPEFQRQ